MLVLSFKNGDEDPASVSFRKILHSIGRNQSLIQYLIINLFFDQPVTNKQDTYEKIYTTGTLLDYLHHQNGYQLIGLYLSRQIFLSKLISQKD